MKYLLLCLSVFLISCGSGSGDSAATGGKFSFTATDYAPHNGQQLVALAATVGCAATSCVYAGPLVGTVSNNTVTLSGTSALLKANTLYDIYWAADVTKDGLCDPAPTDHVWKMQATSDANGNLSVTHVHDTNFNSDSNACTLLNLARDMGSRTPTTTTGGGTGY